MLLTGREGSAIEAAVGTERAAAVVDVEREEKVRRTGDKKEYPSLVCPSSPVTIIVGIISLITIYQHTFGAQKFLFAGINYKTEFEMTPYVKKRASIFLRK